MKRSAAVALVLALGTWACVGSLDAPSSVHDLRVLGVRLDPPEVMVGFCPFQDGGLSGFLGHLPELLKDVDLTALIADPRGQGRELGYELLACANQGDVTCADAGYRVSLSAGATTAGELHVPLPKLAGTLLPGAQPPAPLPDGGYDVSQGNPFLLFEVLQEDTFKGLGGIRLPLVLHVWAPGSAEEIYAQKLMVYTFKCFADQTAGGNPELSGLELQRPDLPFLGPQPGLELVGRGPFEMRPAGLPDPSTLTYHVPAADGTEVTLQESWLISWYTDLGRFSEETTGGTDVGGQTGSQVTRWEPPGGAPEQDVHFWVVVRNGRGGLSWLTPRARYRP